MGRLGGGWSSSSSDIARGLAPLDDVAARAEAAELEKKETEEREGEQRLAAQWSCSARRAGLGGGVRGVGVRCTCVRLRPESSQSTQPPAPRCCGAVDLSFSGFSFLFSLWLFFFAMPGRERGRSDYLSQIFQVPGKKSPVKIQFRFSFFPDLFIYLFISISRDRIFTDED